MTRVPAPLLAGWLVAAGPVVGQAPVAPLPTRLPPGAGVPQPFVTPPIGFVGGFRTPSNGYVMPAYGGYYVAPSLFPFTNNFYANYAVVPRGFGGGFGYGYGGYGYGGYGGGTVVNVINNGDPTPARPPAAPPFAADVSGEESATLVVALPSAGDVWLGGVKQKDEGTTYTLTSPALKPGEQHKFDVRAEWLVNGKRMRADRTITMAAGDRQKLTLVLGEPVK